MPVIYSVKRSIEERTLTQTLIIASCNMNLAAALADRVILLDKGRIIADGNTDKIMSDAKLMLEHGLEVPSGFF